MQNLLHRARGNRLTLAMIVGALLIMPAAGLRLACVGASCDGDDAQAAGPVPFCSLPPRLRALISSGFYDGRSPEVMGVTGEQHVNVGGHGSDWPSLDTDVRVPLVFAGDGVRARAPIPAGTGIDRIAPTLADLIDFNRPFPTLERTDRIPSVKTSSTPRLIVVVGLKGIGTPDLEASPGRWPTIEGLLRVGAGTLEASAGSVPLDPTATLTTMGTGDTPSQHGITGTLIRDREGRLVHAWASQAPSSVIATLAEDLDEHSDQRTLVGLVAGEPSDQGLVGGDWYLEHDRDFRAFSDSPDSVVDRALRSLGDGFGDDDVPDVLGVVLEGGIDEVDAAIGRLVDATSARVRATLFVVAGTGSARATGGARSVDVDRAIRSSVGDVVEGEVAGGLFLDADRLAALGSSRQDVRDALATMTDPGGRPVMSDSFLSYSVSFGRYC